MRTRNWLYSIPLVAASLTYSTPAQARIIRGTNVSAADSDDTSGAHLPASALVLETGATTGVLEANPVANQEYTFNYNGPVGSTDGLFVRGSNTARVNSNGFISLSNNNRGCGDDTSNTNFDLNLACRSKQFLPFWDELRPVDGVSSYTYGYTSGTGDDFWYIQWNEFALASNAAARLTFRVTYYENRGIVRYNYIKLQGTGADGVGATIGLISSQRALNGENNYNISHARRLLYSFNQAVLPTGNAAVDSLFAIEFGIDADGDGAFAYYENQAGSSDTEFDSDGCGEGDASELLNGRDPNTADCASSDDLVADSDADGLTNADEDFYGTNAAEDDTDNDFAPDGAELIDMGTDVLVADTDGDGWLDGEEDLDFDGDVDNSEDDNLNGILDDGEDDDSDTVLSLQESSPLDSKSLPGRQIMKAVAGSGVTQETQANHMEFFVDASGNMHFIAEERGSEKNLLYGLIKSDGTTGIAPTVVITGQMGSRKPFMRVSEGVVTVVYTAHPSDPYEYNMADAGIGFVQFSIAGHALDGTALASQTPTTNLFIDVPGAVTHWSAVFDGQGRAHCFYDDQVSNHAKGFGTPSHVRYVRLSATGNIEDAFPLAFYPQGTTDNNNDTYGQHRVQDARAAVDKDGRVHVAWLASVAPQNQTGNYEIFPTGLYYAVIAVNGSVRGPFYVSDGRFERIDIAVHPDGRHVYFAGTSKSNDDDGFYELVGVRAAVLDYPHMNLIPRVGDAYGVGQAIAEDSFVLPMSTIWNPTDGDGTMGGRLQVMDNGTGLFSFASGGDNDIDVLTFNAYGHVNGVVEDLSFGNNQSYSQNRRLVIHKFGADYGVLASRWGDRDLRFGKIKGSFLPAEDFGGINGAPSITSEPPVAIFGVGGEFKYKAKATDDSTDSSDLRWSIRVGPASSVISASGVVTWTPSSLEIGDTMFSVRVCDDDAAHLRCTNQDFVVTVAAVAPPAPAQAVVVEDGGCGCAGSSPASGLAMFAGLAAWYLSRRRTGSVA